ncbi:hypothetical protein [Halomicrobium sp. LC1Hm]|uniref:hypothetical protein n=1 Tax=Halomicrobium sp. LC1Hm TaxID=2610902 RepID=UPI0012982EFC|nr:hypothetical protein [Halomicrobium sp. LC1Hm]QGA82008.1 hypothetical protein LC1Hm_0946 [Halomicrobium sp. LC1Hm]
MTDDDVGPDLPPIADALRDIEERAGLHDDDDDDRTRPVDLTLTESKLAYPTHAVPGREATYYGESPEDADGGGLGADLVPIDEADEAGDLR